MWWQKGKQFFISIFQICLQITKFLNMQLYNTGAYFLNREKWYNYMNVWKSSITNYLWSWNSVLTQFEVCKLTFIVLGFKLYDSLSVNEFLNHIFFIGELLFILLGIWTSYSPRESLGMLAAQSFTTTSKTKHSPTKQHRKDNAA